MKRTKLRFGICLALLAGTLLFIWGNSCLPAEYSSAFSSWVRNQILVPLFGLPAVPPDEVGGLGILRKVAHFLEFWWLGMCLSWLMYMLRTKVTEVLPWSLGAGALVACIDEGIQLFVPGRNSSFKDVGIDVSGVLLGILVISLIAWIIHGKSKILEETNV